MRTLIYSNLFIALCAAILTLGTYGLIEAEPNIFLVLHVFGVTLMAYNVQRLARLEKFSNRTDQIRWYLRNKWMLYTSLLIGVLLAGITLFFLPFKTLLYFSPLAAVSIFYSIPLGKSLTIRAIPGIKIFLIALVWTGVTLALPMVMVSFEFDGSAGLLLFQRLLFVLAITIPFDIRDLKYDESRMKTLPQILGVKRAKRMAMGFILICLIIELNLQGFGGQTEIQKPILLLFYLLVGILIHRTSEDSDDIYFTGVLDGTMLLLGLILILF